jgi:serine/threonine protein kinase
VLISEEGAVKLADFDVAQIQQHAVPGEIAGKVSYLAPEQLRGEATDHRVDLFAAGVLLYELCTGSHPFRQPGRKQATWRAILAGRYLPPEMVRLECAPALSHVIRRALHTHPAKRPASAGEMAMAFQAAVPIDLRVIGELATLVQNHTRRREEATAADTGAVQDTVTASTAMDRAVAPPTAVERKRPPGQ